MSSRFAASLIVSATVLFASPAFGQIVLPWSDGFEGTGGETYTADTAALAGAPDWAFENADPAGRLRLNAGAGYARTGSAAATLDRSPAGADQVNLLTFTGDMSNYAVATDTVVLDFSFMDHGEDPDPSDRVWIRGTSTASWVEIADLNALAGPIGSYTTVEDLDVSGALATAGQDFGGTFQVRFGQEDDSPSTGIANGDGMTFDDVGLRLIGPDDMAPTAVIEPLVGECGSALTYVEIEVTNFGGNTVSAVPVELVTTDAGGVATTLSGTVAGPLAFLDTATLTLGPVDLFVGGLTDFAVTTMLPGDTDPANDLYLETIELAAGAVPLEPIDGACPGYPTTLETAAEGATVYTWWDAETGGTNLGTGPTFTTPALTAEATYWVERTVTTGTAGAIDNTIGTGGFFPDYTDGLVFDVATPSSLDSLLVYAEGPGDLTVNLEDGAGLVLDSFTTVVAAGANVVAVGFDLPVGTGYILNAQGTTVSNLYRNTSGALFPYAMAGGEVTITGNVNGLVDYYYYFYDWQITAGGCDEGRTEVVVPVGIAECDADLSVAVAGPPEIVPGTTTEYTIEVWNHGPDPLTSYDVTAVAPAVLTDPAVTGACAAFPCSLTDLAPGASVSITAAYDAAPELTSPDALDFSVTSVPTGGETDPAPANDTGALALAVVPHVDLRLDVTEEDDPLIVGGVGSYLVHVENAGPSAAEVVIHAQPAPEFSAVRTLLDACAEGEEAVPDCTLGLLGPEEFMDVLYEADVPLAASPGTVLSLWSVASNAVEDAPGDELWAEETELAVGADLELTMTVFSENVIAGGTFDVVLRAVNRGPDPVLQGTVQLELPDGVQAATLPSGCDAELRCGLDPMTLGEYSEVVVPVRSASDATGSLTLTATARSERPDPELDDNVQTAEFDYRFAAELAVTATVGEGPFAGGDTVAVSLRVENRGPSDVNDVSLVFDMPPAGLVVEDCALDDLNDSVCDVPGALPAGESTAVVVEMVAAEDALGTFSIPIDARSHADAVGDGGTVLDVTIEAASAGACADCESSFAGDGRPPLGLLLLGLVALARRRRQ